MKEKVYVVGHKNPDTDSICAALAYARLKQNQGINAIACRLGPLNEETKFVLKKFDIMNPLLLKDARSQIKDIETDTPTLITPQTSMKEAWEKLFVLKNKSLFVVDDKQKLIGVVSTSNLALIRLMLDEELQALMRKASLMSIAKTIGGEIVVNIDPFKSNGRIFIVTLKNDEEYLKSFEGSVCILSDDDKKQKKLIEAGVKCLIITCGQEITSEVEKFAAKMGCAIIKTSNDSMKVARVINESFPIESIMTKKVITYKDSEYVDDVSKKIASTRYRSYPVLDDDGTITGAVSRYHLLNYQPKKFILVDHSSKIQTINNIEDAEVEEIIDHHHIGNIETSKPIMYRNQRCGCTCSIIAQLYKENNIPLTQDMAGIMLSAIISDTLYFKSQTTTPFDIERANELAVIANIDLDSYAEEMLSASVALKNATPSQILNRDLKNYEIGRYRIAVGQTNYRNVEDIQKIIPKFKATLVKEQEEKNLDLMIMMFTHVMAEGTLFVYSGPLAYMINNLIATVFDESSGYDHDIISRKQQLIPQLSSLLKNM